MNKTLYLLIALISVVNVHATYAQHLWGISGNKTGSSVYHISLEGSHYTKSFVTQSDLPGGKNPQFITQGADGNIYGISESENSGVIFRINQNGLTRLAELPKAVIKNASLVHTASGYLYGVGESASAGKNTLFRLRSNGKNLQLLEFQGTDLAPSSSILLASNGLIYGLAEAGGSKNAGYLYRIRADFSGIDILHHFNSSSGKKPMGKLVEGKDGMLCGITNLGGIHNAGVVFQIGKDGAAFSVIHHFNNALGSSPSGGLAVDENGTLYGTTVKGGRYNKGIIFRLAREGKNFKVIHHFAGNLGEFPEGQLQLNSNTLYGTAMGGNHNSGVLFSIGTDGTNFRNIKDFKNESPLPALILSRKEITPNMILLSPMNGSANGPVVWNFKARAWAGPVSYVLELSTSSDFTDPLSYESSDNFFKVSGLKFSTTYYARVKTTLWPYFGPSTSFKTRAAEDYAYLTKPVDGSSEIPLSTKISVSEVPGATHYKLQLSTSADFSSSLMSDSSRVPGQRTFTISHLESGTRYYARVKSNAGSGFGKVTTFSTISSTPPGISFPSDGTLQDYDIMRISVAPLEGAQSYSLLISTTPDFSAHNIQRSSVRDGQNDFVLKNLLPATTYYVKAKSNLSETYSNAITFTTRQAISPKRLWGLTTIGGDYGFGTVFSFSLDSMTLMKHHDYVHTEGYMYLKGDLVQTPYGFAATSISDGTGGGEVFSLSSEGFKLLLDYGPHDGSIMMASDNNLYVVDDWVNMFQGGIYRLHPNAETEFTLESVIHGFEGDRDGLNPTEQLLELPDGFLYGVAPSGGAYNHGTAFRIKLDGTNFEVLHHFRGSDGSSPSGSLIQGENGAVYGVADKGGASGEGVIFSFSPDTRVVTKIFDFAPSLGAGPKSNLTSHAGKLWGTTSAGGAHSLGVVFSLNYDGSGYQKMFDFDGAHGSQPLGGVSIDETGNLYGMTSRGGANNLGVIYKISNGTVETLLSFSNSTGGAPDGKLLIRDDHFALPGSRSEEADIAANEITTGGLLIYPNPFTNSFTAQLTGEAAEDVQFLIADFNGSIVESYKGPASNTVSMGDALPRGLYVLKVIKGNTTSTYRLLKK